MMRSFVALCLVAAPAMAAKGLDSARIEQITGLKGQWTEKEGVFKVQVPRSDLAVTAAGAKVTPPLGLTTWAAFTTAGAHTVVMGDIVLTEDQVNPAMDAALQNGLEVTALHNHFFWENPRVMFMHVGGMGEEENLAQLARMTAARSAARSWPVRRCPALAPTVERPSSASGISAGEARFHGAFG